MKDNTKLLVVSSAAALAVGAGLWYYTPMLAWIGGWNYSCLILLIMFSTAGLVCRVTSSCRSQCQFI